MCTPFPAQRSGNPRLRLPHMMQTESVCCLGKFFFRGKQVAAVSVISADVQSGLREKYLSVRPDEALDHPFVVVRSQKSVQP
jgi:hypothetical protein